ncbi:MAG: O-antigen ligase family protein [Acidobacteriota bacterium]
MHLTYTAPLMERASRLVLTVSIGLAGAVHAWLASGRPGLATGAAVTFLLCLLVARAWPGAVLVAVCATAYMFPAMTYAVFGVSDYHTTLIWLAALAALICSRMDVSRWHLPPPWRMPCVAWALILAVSWPVVAARELDFTFVAARVSDVTSGAYQAPPRLAAAWIVIVALSQMLGLLWLDWLWARFGQRHTRDAERLVLLPIVVGAAAGALVAIYQGAMDLRWLNLDYWASINRAGGLMLDANTLGIGAAVWGPASVALAWRRSGSSWPAAGLWSLFAAAMWMSGSRTALLAFTVGSAGVAVAIAQRRGLWQPRMAPILLLVGSALLVLAMAIAPRGGSSSSPLQRVFDRLPGLEAVELRRFAGEMWTRFGYGQAAVSMSADYPLTGVGIGAFHVVSADYIVRDLGRTLDPDNAQNWWRHQVAELGLLGALPSVWLSLVITALLWRGSPLVTPTGVATVLRAVLIGVGLASLLGVPTQHPVSWLSFVTVLYWLTAAGTDPDRPVRSARIAGWLVGFGLAAVVAGGQWMHSRGALRVPSRALESHIPFSYGLSPPEGTSQYGDLRWSAAQSVQVFAVPHRWLQLTVWAPGRDVTARPVSFRATLDGDPVISYTLTDLAPTTFFLEMRGAARWAMLELTVISPAADGVGDRRLPLATAWLRELPGDAPPERTIRR